MTEDSPAAARLRRLREVANAGSPAEALLAGDVDAVLVELGEARRRPRVWLEGDTVPAGVAVIDEPGAQAGEFWVATDKPSRFDRDVLEVHVPDLETFTAAVAAEREHRAGVPDA